MDTSRHLLPSARGDGPPSTRRKTTITSRRASQALDEFSMPSFGAKREYISRRGKVYDDTDSEGEADPSNPRFLDTGVIKYRDTLGKVYRIEPNPRFIRYKNAFTNLMKQTCIVTRYPVVNLIISNDSSRAVVVSKANDL